jgi:hypothetical protein
MFILKNRLRCLCRVMSIIVFVLSAAWSMNFKMQKKFLSCVGQSPKLRPLSCWCSFLRELLSTCLCHFQLLCVPLCTQLQHRVYTSRECLIHLAAAVYAFFFSSQSYCSILSFSPYNVRALVVLPSKRLIRPWSLVYMMNQWLLVSATWLLKGLVIILSIRVSNCLGMSCYLH